MKIEDFFDQDSDLKELHTYIQWKGTQVCMDFHCPCGFHSHWDVDFAYAIRCPSCKKVYQLSDRVICREAPADYDGCVQENYNED